MPASPNSLTHGRDLAQATGQPAERPEARPSKNWPSPEPSSQRFHAPDGSARPDRRRRRTRHRSAVAVLSALSARIDLVIASRSGAWGAGSGLDRADRAARPRAPGHARRAAPAPVPRAGEPRPVRCAHARSKPPLRPPRAPLRAHRPGHLRAQRGGGARDRGRRGARARRLDLARPDEPGGSTTRRRTCRRSASARSCARPGSVRSSRRTIRTMRSARPCRVSSAGRSTRSRRTRCLCCRSMSPRASRRVPTSARSG